MASVIHISRLDLFPTGSVTDQRFYRLYGRYNRWSGTTAGAVLPVGDPVQSRYPHHIALFYLLCLCNLSIPLLVCAILSSLMGFLCSPRASV